MSRTSAQTLPRINRNSRFQSWYFVLVLSLLLSISLVALSKTVPAQEDIRPSFADLAERLLPAVVNISTTQVIQRRRRSQTPFPEGSPFNDLFRRFFEQRNTRPREVTSLGSGFIIDAAKGFVVTNHHVIEEADQISVILQNDVILEATVIGHDERNDIAVLRIPTTPHELQEVTFGNSDNIRVGDWVLAIGNPFGLGGTVTAGIVSARSRFLENGLSYIDYIQTDASINKGNSGGPMFNLNGEVIGVNTLIITPSGGSVGIGFAIPSLSIQTVVDQIIEFGRVRRGWLGVQIQEVTSDIAEALNLPNQTGALVVSINSNGPSADSGIQDGDVILKFNDTLIQRMRELPRIVAQTEIGLTVDVVVWRNNEEHIFQVVIGDLENAEQSGWLEDPQEPQETPPDTILGLKLTSITPELRRQYNLNRSLHGVVIVEVERDSRAYEKGIQPGSVILSVNDHTVSTPQEAIQQIQAVRNSGRRSVLLRIIQDRRRRFVALPLNEG